MKSILPALLATTAIFSGCHRELTQAETEQQVLAATFRYYYDHDLPTQVLGPTPKVVFVGEPSKGWTGAIPDITYFFSEPPPEWLAALVSTGISTQPATAASYDPDTRRFLDPATKEMAMVFCVESIVLTDPNTATVKIDSSSGPLAGGRSTYQLEKKRRTWRVVDSQITAVH